MNRQYNSALEDLDQAMDLCSTNHDVKKLISKINDEINGLTNNSHNSNGQNSSTLKQKKQGS